MEVWLVELCLGFREFEPWAWGEVGVIDDVGDLWGDELGFEG